VNRTASDLKRRCPLLDNPAGRPLHSLWKGGALQRLFVVLTCLLLGSRLAHGQGLPPCQERAHRLESPWVDGLVYCLEEVLNVNSAGELAYTALATAPDGTLYATRPLAGQVLAIEDTDADGLPDMPRVIAEGLALPNGLVYHEDSLYISGGSHVYRLAGDSLETLVDNLPAGVGFWTGGVAVGHDDRLYVATGAPCDFCEPADPKHGAILSYALDGTDQQLVATGLRHPADIAFFNGNLWTVDTARDALFDTPNLDELNRVVPASHFGWPYCIGIDNHQDWTATAFDCENATPPVLALPTHSAPLGLAAYTSDTFPSLTDSLLVALGGSYNQVELRGFQMIAISLQGDQPTGYTILMPSLSNRAGHPELSQETVQYSGAGFWPQRPLDIAVSTQGWVYISVSGGRILALRPR